MRFNEFQKFVPKPLDILFRVWYSMVRVETGMGTQEGHMDTQEIVRRLTEIGGRQWQKGDMNRMYFNADVVYEAIGLEMTRYGTGNISSAMLRGEHISNAEAKRIIAGIPTLYYDLTAGKLMRKGEWGETCIRRELNAEFKSFVMAALAETGKA